jgi:hypothetical protein
MTMLCVLALDQGQRSDLSSSDSPKIKFSHDSVSQMKRHRILSL